VTGLLVRAAGRTLPAAAALWAALIVAAPWAAVAPDFFGVPRFTAAATYLTGAVVCHQRPDRSFHSHGVRWPVCARCSGLYVSAGLGVVLAWLWRPPAAAVPFHAWRWILLAAAVPTAGTMVAEWWNPQLASGLARALAAAPLGGAAGVMLAASMSFQGRLRRCEPTR
jgi:hypothetical protein